MRMYLVKMSNDSYKLNILLIKKKFIRTFYR